MGRKVASGENVVRASADAVEPMADAAHGGHDHGFSSSSWSRYYSEYGTYRDTDLLEHHAWEEIRKGLDAFRPMWLVVKVAAALLVSLALASVVAMMWISVAGTAGESTLGTGDAIAHGGATGLCPSRDMSVTDCHVAIATSSVAVASLLFGLAGLAVWFRWTSFRRAVDELREITRNAKQIYSGAGKLKFAYGLEGLLIEGNNMRVSLGWDAIEDSLLLSRRTSYRRGVRKEVVEVEYWPKKADLLLVFLKPISGRLHDNHHGHVTHHASGHGGNSLLGFFFPAHKDHDLKVAEYIVIPKHFFDSFRGSVAWEDFCDHITEYMRKFRSP